MKKFSEILHLEVLFLLCDWEQTEEYNLGKKVFSNPLMGMLKLNRTVFLCFGILFFILN